MVYSGGPSGGLRQPSGGGSGGAGVARGGVRPINPAVCILLHDGAVSPNNVSEPKRVCVFCTGCGRLASAS